MSTVGSVRDEPAGNAEPLRHGRDYSIGPSIPLPPAALELLRQDASEAPAVVRNVVWSVEVVEADEDDA